jgi:fibronectin type 3 domain-containing protein
MFAQTVPAQYQAIYNTVTTEIGSFQTTVSQNWNGTPYPVAWAPHLLSAESDNYLQLLQANHYSESVANELQELQATGAKAVTLHISFPILYQPFYTDYSGTPSNYQAFVSFYQQVAAGVHAAGMKLVVEATVAEQVDGTGAGAAFAPYYQTLDWNDYMAGRAQNAVNIAQLIQPDYLSLICEPDTEANDASQPTENTPTGALQLLQTELTALQQANITNVSLGGGAGTWITDFTTYLQDFATTSLDYIDMHVYILSNGDLMNVLTGASIIQQSGKGIGVTEAWPDKASGNEGSLNINIIDSRDTFSFWAPVDTAFLQAMVDCAQYDQFLFFGPSYPSYFAAYLNYDTYGTDTPAQLLGAAFLASFDANQAGTFTSTGVAFSKMIVGNDTTPPVTPSAPTRVTSSSTGATITWIPTTDNVGVAGYNIYRDGAVVAQTANTKFVNTGLTPGDTYTYDVSAFDAQGNVSPQSETLTITLVDLTPPTVPKGLAVAGVTQTSVSLTWLASTGGGGVGGYRVLKGTSPSTIKVVDSSVPTTSYVDSEVAPGTTYYYAVESYNLTGVSSAPSTTISATTLALPPPTGLQATAVTASSVSLSWTAPGGSDPPASYRILKGTSPSSLKTIANSTGTTYTDSHVVKLTTYYYEVEMVDSSGRASGPSNLLTVTTP